MDHERLSGRHFPRYRLHRRHYCHFLPRYCYHLGLGRPQAAAAFAFGLVSHHAVAVLARSEYLACQIDCYLAHLPCGGYFQLDITVVVLFVWIECT